MTIFLRLLTLSFPLSLTAEMVDLVKHGRETFHAVGCAECHSEIQNDTAVKTGPGLYGLFQKKPRERKIITEGEAHRLSVKADFSYFLKSLRSPHSELAIAEQGATKGQPYLPVMPPYDQGFISDFKARAMHQYLLTLNDAPQRGPAKVMVEQEKKARPLTPEEQPGELLVTDRTRIQRVRLNHCSSRVIAVGHPSGLNYTFDPRNLSVERVWWGGFLNIKHELEGRAGSVSTFGHKKWLIPHTGPLLQPVHPDTGKLVELTYKTPVAKDYKTIAKLLHSPKDFEHYEKEADADFLGYRHAETPTFFFRCGPNKIEVRFHTTPDGKASFTVDGTLVKPQKFRRPVYVRGGTRGEYWTVTKVPATLEFKLPSHPADQKIWRPQNVSHAPFPQLARTAPASEVQAPAEFQAQSIFPPTDRHGRPQLFEPMGMDTAPDGSLVITTRTAGVWRLKDERWHLIAEGLLDALGVIAEKDGSLVIAQKPELTRLRDTDRDGYYETYETLSDDFLFTTNYHEYLHGPAKDSQGNYYIQTNLAEHKKTEAIYKADGKWMGSQGGYRAWSLQVTPSGQTKPFARGLRSPAGLATGPDGRLYYTENQGEFTGTSKLYLLQKDRYYGHPSGLVDLPGMTPDSPEIHWEKWAPKKELALALLPHSRLSNSPGSPTWAPPESPFNYTPSQMFIGDQTLSNIFRVQLHPNYEAAVIPFAQNFPSGVMRLCFGKDRAMYVGQTGRGWRAKGGKEAALVRLLPTKRKAANHLLDVTRQGESFTFHFRDPLASANVGIAVSSWHYLDTPEYGSPETDRTQETPAGPPILSSDRRSLTLTLQKRPLPTAQLVYHFQTSELPTNNGRLMETFFTRNNTAKPNNK